MDFNVFIKIKKNWKEDLSSTWKFFSIFLFIALIEKSSAQSFDCLDPAGNPGYCINLKRCLPLIQLLRKATESDLVFLKQSVCGYDDNIPRVCCLNNDSAFTYPDNSSTQPPAQTETPPPPVSQSLNDICGVVDPDITYTKVIGGVPAKLGAWPWMAALGYRGPNARIKWACGGSLITSSHVLTAAHCVFRQSTLSLVRLGDLNLDENIDDGATPVDIPIDRAVYHPDYNPTHVTNDVAVLKLQYPVEFTKLIKPICLPFNEIVRERHFVGALPFVAGWGTISYRGRSANDLQQLQIPVVSLQSCKNAFSPYKEAVIDERVYCAGYANGGKDACQGDSGGPLMFPHEKKFYVIGIVSYGIRCAQPGIPGVYTRTGKFLDFIQTQINY